MFFHQFRLPLLPLARLREIHKKDLSFDDMTDEISVEDEDFWVCRINKVRYLFDSDKINPNSIISIIQKVGYGAEVETKE